MATALVLLAVGGVQDVDRTIERSIACRDGIRTYHLVVRSHVVHQNRPSDPPAIERMRYEVWSDGRRLRCDRTRTESTIDPKGVGSRSVWCRNCPRDGYVATAHVGAGFLSPLRFRKDDRGRSSPDSMWVDWARLGFLDSDVTDYSQRRPDSTLAELRDNPHRAHDRVVVHGCLHHRVTVTYDRGGRMEAWFRPDLGMNPVRYRSEIPTGSFVQETTVEYAPADPDLWFPTAVRHHRTTAGRTLVDERVAVESAEINQPIPEQVFTEAGFGMPAGTPLAYPEVKQRESQPTWTGEAVDRNRTLGKQAAEAYRVMSQSDTPVPDAPEPGRNWPYYLGGGVLAVVGGVLVTRAVRRRAAAG